MAWVDEVRFNTRAGVRAAEYVAIRQEFVDAFWKWYHEHDEDVVVSRRVLFFKIELRVWDMLPVFERLFGPKPR